MNKWWGYLHTDGSIHAKRYFDPQDIYEARESSFVAQIHGPFDAESSGDAASILLRHFGRNEGGSVP
jgi:hypothetical protein